MSLGSWKCSLDELYLFYSKWFFFYIETKINVNVHWILCKWFNHTSTVCFLAIQIESVRFYFLCQSYAKFNSVFINFPMNILKNTSNVTYKMKNTRNNWHLIKTLSIQQMMRENHLLMLSGTSFLTQNTTKGENLEIFEKLKMVL